MKFLLKDKIIYQVIEYTIIILQVYFGKTKEMVCTLRPPSEVVMKLPDSWCGILWHDMVNTWVLLYRSNVLGSVLLLAHIYCISCMFYYLGSYIRHRLCIISRPVADLKICCCVVEKIDAHWIGNSIGILFMLFSTKFWWYESVVISTRKKWV